MAGACAFPAAPIRKSTTTGVRANRKNARFCYPRLEAGQPTVCSETCVGRIRYLGVVLYDADRIEEAASDRTRNGSLPEHSSIFSSTPNDPEGHRQARADGVSRYLAGIGEEIADLENGDGMEDRLSAASGIPHPAYGLVYPTVVASSRSAWLNPGSLRLGRRRDAGCSQICVSPFEIFSQPSDRRQRRTGGAKGLERMMAMRVLYALPKQYDGAD